MAGTKGRGFHALLAAQSSSALNDNIFKMIVLLIARSVSGEGRAETMIAYSGILFVLPYLLFSTAFGALADRFSKRSVIICAKIIEVIVAMGAAWALQTASFPWILFFLFMMGFHAALISPAKYGILPEILDEKDIPRGNGLFEMVSYLAIILGMAAGGLLFGAFSGSLGIAGLVLVGIAVLGTIASFFVLPTPAADPSTPLKINIPADIHGKIRELSLSRRLFSAVLALAFFWFLGGVFHLNITLYTGRMMHLGGAGTGLLTAVVAVGIGLGSVIAGRLSKGRVELGLTAFGALGLILFSLDLGFSFVSRTRTAIDLFLLGISGGLYIVPLYSFIQVESPGKKKGAVMGTMNFIAFAGILASSGIIYAAGAAGISPAGTFIFMAFLTGAVFLLICRALPEIWERGVLRILIDTFYHFRLVGGGNVPRRGGAVVVSNHVSYLDPLILMLAFPRRIRFMAFSGFFSSSFLHFFLTRWRVIPVSGSPGEIKRAFAAAAETLSAGEIVVVFAEGGITRTGHIQPFMKGFERIASRADVPLIPVHIRGMWGSIFSFKGRRFFWKIPSPPIPRRITVSIGRPLPSGVRAWEARREVEILAAEAAIKAMRSDRRTLHGEFIRSSRLHPFREAVRDRGGSLSYLGLLYLAILLAGKIRRLPAPSGMVGILLPPSRAAAAANLAVLMAGRTPVNLNPTLPAEELEVCIERCRIERILAPAGTDVAGGGRMIPIEDLIEAPSLSSRLHAGILATARLILPVPRGEGRAAVLFTSGSTGSPKGVVLSHANILSNIESLNDLLPFERDSRVLGVLPFFHVFGLTTGLYLPLITGRGGIYHPNPLDTKGIARLIADSRPSILPITPTFLRKLIKRLERKEARSPRFIFTGAEKLPSDLSDETERIIGIRPSEGYGTTETSPIVAVNLEDVEDGQVRHKGRKDGTVGRPIPGVAVKVVSPDTGESLAPGEEGLLLVKGPNVMCGYLGMPDETAAVMRDGWYDTGDMAMVDEEGFITITGRASRFSKIGGEMVPHLKVEEEIARILAGKGRAVVVGVADPEKGEHLAVVHTPLEMKPPEIVSSLRERGLPNLWIPKPKDFIEVEEIPLMASGKIDLEKVKTLSSSRSRRPL